jgi:predicted nucleotidyltransferase
MEDVKRLDKRVTSGAVHEIDVIEKTRQELQEMNQQMKELRLTSLAPDRSQQGHDNLLVTMEKSQVAIEDEFEGLFRDIRESHETAKRLNELLQKGADQPQHRMPCSHAQKEDLITAEGLVLCRWLLEHLPATTARHGMLSHHWKQFWNSQWKQGKETKRGESHPLWGLIGEERYNRVGKALYSTLSSRIHGYGQFRGERLPPDVQRVVDKIKPIHFRKDGKINLEAERLRWLS